MKNISNLIKFDQNFEFDQIWSSSNSAYFSFFKMKIYFNITISNYVKEIVLLYIQFVF